MNRRERRNAKHASDSSSLNAASDIPLSHPPRSNTRKTRTLYEVAAEKQTELSKHGQPFSPIPGPDQKISTQTIRLAPDGSLHTEEPTLTVSPATYTSTNAYPVSSSAAEVDQQSAEIPLLDTLFTSLTLSALHFTLSILTAHQYAQSIDWASLSFQTLLAAFPILTFLVHLTHGHIIHVPFVTPPTGPSSLRNDSRALTTTLPLQLIFLGLANTCGCHLVALTNDRGYYAVMKRAPSIGTLWVWSVLELGLIGAMGGVAGPAAYAWWYGYGIL